MIDKEYGEIAIGEVRHSIGRTVTETDVVTFCMLTGNWLELHSNAEFAKSTRFGQRVVQGSLVFSIVNALLPFDSGLVEAFYGVDKLRFIAPTFIGDTLKARTEIIRMKDRDETAGVVTILLEGVNQHGKTVMRCEFSLLIRKTRRIDSNDN